MSFDFEITDSKLIEGVKIITPSVHNESRGAIWTSFNAELHSLIPNDLSFQHDKFSSSRKNVLRGIHGDHKSWKLVSCVFGEIFQVVVDLRKDSPSYLKYDSIALGNNCPDLVLIPPGLGNAFYVKSSVAIYHYKLAYEGEYVDAGEQFTVAWNDPRINIDWPTSTPILSERDGRL